jgi:DNA-binding transcriptional LysR family regulator
MVTVSETNALAACRRARITPNAIFDSDQFASIFALVAAGTGVRLVTVMAAASAESFRVAPLHPEKFRRIVTRTFAVSLGRPLKRRSSSGSSAPCSRLDDLARS